MRPILNSTSYQLTLRFFSLCCLFCLWQQVAKGERFPATNSDHDSLEVVSIDIIGNNITRERIVMRELSFRIGSKIARKNIDVFFELEENKLRNTNLFNEHKIYFYETAPGKISINILLQERWYTFPIPILEISDRNFNEWWQNQNRNLNRLQYGINFKRRNFRGRNESLGIVFKAGFTQMARLVYSIPFIDRKQTLGLTFRIDYSRNRNMVYNNINHKLVNMTRENGYIRQRFNTSLTLTKRKGFYQFHDLGLKYSNNQIADTVAYMNPFYFEDGATQQRNFSLRYTYSYDYRDFSAYPLKGYYFQAEAIKLGLGIFNDINTFDLSASFSKYFDLGKDFYFATNLSGKLSLPEVQPYSVRQGLGYSSNIVRGYDLYVIDGTAFGLVKNTLRFHALEESLNLEKIMPIKQFNRVPINIYLKTYFDVGHVRNAVPNFYNTEFTNRNLWGGGFGLDFVTYYNAVWRFEYSFNAHQERGFFIYFTTDI